MVRDLCCARSYVKRVSACHRVVVLLLAAGVAGSSVAGCHHEDTKKGEAIYRERCGLCHPTGSDDAQGPGLGGVFGRAAATGTGFPYSGPLRSSGFTWDRATLDRFLEDPSRAVPGTRMPIPVPDPNDRKELIAYLATLRADPNAKKLAADASDRAAPAAPEIPDAPPGLRAGAAGFGDYRADGPGVRRHFTVADLPAPYTTPPARNAPKVVPRPKGRVPHVPPGFRNELFVEGLDAPRLLRVAPNGDIFVAESTGGRVRAIRAKDGARAPEKNEVFASGLLRPFGIAFYPPGPNPQFVYVAEDNAVSRFPYKAGDLVATSKPEVVVPELAHSSGGHWTRDIGFSPDGKRMYVSVGSASNVAEDQADTKISPKEQAQALGASSGEEDRRADVLVFDPDGTNGHVFATGIRNCVGLSVQPGTGDVWCSTNERDGLGDDLVPDYVTRVREGAFYGWPWFYLGAHEDPRHKGARPDLADKITVPDVLIQPHSASLQMTFYDGTMFPEPYRGQAFAALHGSWNRTRRTGYKVVRIALENGAPTGEYEDFMTGFVVDDASVWGRPVGVAVTHDGALLVSEDGAGTIWRVTATR
jgi:glucose/arabinose dehydrogenase/cytochrome c2